MASTRPAWIGRGALLAAALGVAAACAPAGPDAATRAAVQGRATQVLDNWATAVKAAGGEAGVVPVGELTGQVGDWEMPFGDNAKPALMAGLVQTESDLAAPAPSTATVTFADGSTASVRVLGAQEGIAAIARSGEAAACPDCSPLIAVSATLVTAPIKTTRGAATGPVWEYAIRGTAVRVTRIAIAGTIEAPALSDGPPSGTMSIDSASASAGGMSVTVSFVGAPDPASKPCGEDYTADAVESDLAVTVLVWRHTRVTLTPEACALVGASRTATATLAKPLGDRPVLDPMSGQPVVLTLAP